MQQSNEAPSDRSSDEELAKEAARGSMQCFEELASRYYKRVFRYICGKVKKTQDAEDIAQDAFLNVYKHLDTFDSSYMFKTWLFAIARNCMVSYLRKDKRFSALQDLPDSVGVSAKQEKKVEDCEQLQRVWEAAKKLPLDQFTALWLRYHEEMDLKNIAAVMNKSYGNVRVLLHRARNSIPELIAEQDII